MSLIVIAAAASIIMALQANRPIAATTVIVIAFLVAAGTTMWSAHITMVNDDPPPLRDREAVALIGATVLLGVALVPASPVGPIGLGWVSMPALLLAVAIIRSPRRRRFPLLVGASVLYIGATVHLVNIGEVSVRMVVLVPLGFVSLTLTIWLQWWNFDVARQLELSRRVAADLAVAEERLRFAAELHDIQGHHLQVIALKSELALRLAATRPEEAADEMRHVQRLARQALSDTRAVVAGYRAVSLRTEISNATRVLEAAGIAAHSQVPSVDDGWDTDRERLMGLLVREATTNILRHAHPSRASFHLELDEHNAVIRVNNDGATTADDATGTGLAALTERFHAAGGSMRWQRHDGEFSVSAILPYRSGHDSTRTGDVT